MGFLGIDRQEVIDIIRKVLLSYKTELNKRIDVAIEFAINEIIVTTDSLEKQLINKK